MHQQRDVHVEHPSVSSKPQELPNVKVEDIAAPGIPCAEESDQAKDHSRNLNGTDSNTTRQSVPTRKVAEEVFPIGPVS
eukprot:CAMPEP_0115259058 /NCGR_PEP_ID=MMETSP0270-20121206/47626_1 /TAXON_ID=71861 /ORGANISM="Scrippsiella trochoidea, Strain CCMP3099" /LENGTH=78 /DNA_ID=CAMNT_0002674851 /DNA_START=371 /DNA_END=607 /DNA_ORIENTATION=-